MSIKPEVGAGPGSLPSNPADQTETTVQQGGANEAPAEMDYDATILAELGGEPEAEPEPAQGEEPPAPPLEEEPPAPPEEDEDPPADPATAQAQAQQREAAINNIFSLDLDLDEFTEGNEPILAKRLQVLGKAAHAMYKQQLEMQQVVQAYKEAETYRQQEFLMNSVVSGAKEVSELYGIQTTPEEVANALSKYGQAIASANGGKLPPDAGMLAWQLANRQKIAAARQVKQQQAPPAQRLPAASQSSRPTGTGQKPGATESMDDIIAKELGIV